MSSLSITPFKTKSFSKQPLRIFLNNMNSWLSNFIIEEFRTDYQNQSNKHNNVFMGTLDSSLNSLPKHFKPIITKINHSTTNYKQEVFSNDIFIYTLNESNLNEAEFLIKGLKALKYETEKTLIIISSIMTWGKTPLKQFTKEEMKAYGFNEEEFIEMSETQRIKESAVFGSSNEEIDLEQKIIQEIMKEAEEKELNDPKQKGNELPGTKTNEKKKTRKETRKDTRKGTRKGTKKNKSLPKDNEEQTHKKENETPSILESKHTHQPSDKTKLQSFSSFNNDKTHHKGLLSGLASFTVKKTFYYKDSEYSKRVPSPKYVQYKVLENLALANNNPMLNVYVICPGFIYGCGEDLFFDYFRMSWLEKPKPIPILGEGMNSIPTIHVLDLVQVIKKVIENKPITRYIVAIDKTKDPSLRNILSSIAGCFGNNHVESLIDFNVDEVDVPNYNEISIDVKIRQSKIIFENMPRFKSEVITSKDNLMDNEFKWHCEYGIPENLSILRKEFCLYRGLQLIKIFVYGPPSSGKSKLSMELSSKYKLIYLNIDNVLKWGRKLKNELGNEIANKYNELKNNAIQALDEYNKRKTKKKTDPPLDIKQYLRLPDELVIKILQARLDSDDCLSKGYVLDGYPKNYEQATLVFNNEAIIPDFVLNIANCTEENLKSNLKTINDYETNAELIDKRFIRRYAEYKQWNENAQNKPLSAFFEEKNIEIFDYDYNKLENEETKEEYIEELNDYFYKNGDIDNNNKLYDDELTAPIMKDENSYLLKMINNNNNKELSHSISDKKSESGLAKIQKMDKYTVNKINELKCNEQKLLEKKSEVLRFFLNSKIVPLISKGILQACKNMPEDPVIALADYIEGVIYNKNKEKETISENHVQLSEEDVSGEEEEENDEEKENKEKSKSIDKKQQHVHFVDEEVLSSKEEN